MRGRRTVPPPATWNADLHGVSAAAAAKSWSEQQEDERGAAVGMWVAIMGSAGDDSQLGEQVQEAGGATGQGMVIMENTFRAKATATLMKRGGSIAAFLRWSRSSGFAAFPLQENVLYQYVEQLRSDGAPATRATAFLEAVPFTISLLGLRGPAWPTLSSKRVHGAALASFDRKRLTAKAPPLTANAVKLLEHGVSSLATVTQRILAGDACFLVHGRLRCDDAARISVEPRLDLDEDGVGYVETVAAGSSTKTGGSRRKRRLGLPVVADACGLSGSWAAEWIALRAAVGLEASRDGALFLAVDGGGHFSRAKRTTAAMSAILRELLVAVGAPSSDGRAPCATSHSCKATALSWAAKAGLRPGSRRLLGGHAKPKDLSMLEYSRDALAPVLRELTAVYAEIVAGTFDPDSTRSGRYNRKLAKNYAVDDSVNEFGVHWSLEEAFEKAKTVISVYGANDGSGAACPRSPRTGTSPGRCTGNSPMASGRGPSMATASGQPSGTQAEGAQEVTLPLTATPIKVDMLQPFISPPCGAFSRYRPGPVDVGESSTSDYNTDSEGSQDTTGDSETSDYKARGLADVVVATTSGRRVTDVFTDGIAAAAGIMQHPRWLTLHIADGARQDRLLCSRHIVGMRPAAEVLPDGCAKCRTCACAAAKVNGDALLRTAESRASEAAAVGS
jgi:hypothetical protein